MRSRGAMRFLLGLLSVASISLLSCVLAQDSKPAPYSKPSPYRCTHYSSDANDPVSAGLRGVLECYSGGFIAIAEEIPPSQYVGQKVLGATVGHNVGHVAFISGFACSKMSGIAAPKGRRVEGEADKDGMVGWLKLSMEFCKKAFAELSDDKLGESIPWNGFDPDGRGGTGQRVTRFGAAQWVTNVLIERYAAFVGYLQLHFSLSPFDAVPLVRASEEK